MYNPTEASFCARALLALSPYLTSDPHSGMLGAPGPPGPTACQPALTTGSTGGQTTLTAGQAVGTAGGWRGRVVVLTPYRRQVPCAPCVAHGAHTLPRRGPDALSPPGPLSTLFRSRPLVHPASLQAPFAPCVASRPLVHPMLLAHVMRPCARSCSHRVAVGSVLCGSLCRCEAHSVACAYCVASCSHRVAVGSVALRCVTHSVARVHCVAFRTVGARMPLPPPGPSFMLCSIGSECEGARWLSGRARWPTKEGG